MTYPTWRSDGWASPRVKQHKPCLDHLVIRDAELDLEIDCPLHDGPLAKMPRGMARRIQRKVERELGITSHLTVTARGWAVAGIASAALWVLILIGGYHLVRAIAGWLS